MKKLKIGARISLGFACVLTLLLAIAITSVSSSWRTGADIGEVDVYDGLQKSANELMHILNETRISAGVLYETHSTEAYGNVLKQLMYCDLRLEKLNEYIGAHPELEAYQQGVASFDGLYGQWASGLRSMSESYQFDSEFSERQEQAFTEFSASLRSTNLRAHEILSNTIADIEYVTNVKTNETAAFSETALYIVIAISAVSLAVAAILAVFIVRSITAPVQNMRDVLEQIGNSGDLRLDERSVERLRAIAAGKDEISQCVRELLVLINRLNEIDLTLSHVAAGDLTARLALQSERDTMGLAVEKMLSNLNQKFGTITSSARQVTEKSSELSEGSRILASGALTQSESVAHLADSVQAVNTKTEKAAILAREAAALVNSIRSNAKVGTDKMNLMINAATEINQASQSIGKVIKVIDDIAFQTNILSLNAAVEAARAGQHGRGFAVVAEEVRSLASKSADAAKDTGSMIENTIKKAALGASIAEETSKSFEDIVRGVEQSGSIIDNIESLSKEQAAQLAQFIGDLRQVETVVAQNSTIASQSADAVGEIADQSNMLRELVSQFHLIGGAPADIKRMGE